AVFMYHDVDGAWVYHSRLPPPTDSPTLGMVGGVIAIDGDYAAVGSSTLDNMGKAQSSTVGVYQWDNTQWNLVQQIDSPDSVGRPMSGYSLAMGGGVLVIGYPNAKGNDGNALVYRLTDAVYVYETELNLDDIYPAEKLGTTCTVSADGSRIILGTYNSSVWSLIYLIVSSLEHTTAQCGVDTDYYPTPLCVSDNNAYIAAGCPGSWPGGDVYLFELDTTDYAGTVHSYQRIDGETPDKEFGESLAMTSDGGLLAINVGKLDQFYIYKRAYNGGYCQVQVENGWSRSSVGASLAFARSDSILLAGAPGYMRGEGVVGVYDISLLD
ncbi:hypothetical protein KIPB_008384, partial [Kipferlia bialata]